MNLPSCIGVDPAVVAKGSSSMAVACLDDRGMIESCTLVTGDATVKPDNRLLLMGNYLTNHLGRYIRATLPNSILIVEGQKKVPTKKVAVSSLIALAQAAGIAGGALMAAIGPSEFFMPTPGEISTLPKGERHGHLWTLPGYSEELARSRTTKIILDGAGRNRTSTVFEDSEWLDVFDSIVIARWAQERWMGIQRRERFKDD